MSSADRRERQAGIPDRYRYHIFWAQLPDASRKNTKRMFCPNLSFFCGTKCGFYFTKPMAVIFSISQVRLGFNTSGVSMRQHTGGSRVRFKFQIEACSSGTGRMNCINLTMATPYMLQGRAFKSKCLSCPRSEANRKEQMVKLSP